MRKKNIICFLLFSTLNSSLLTFNSFAQWIQQSVPVTSGQFFDMKFANANTGFIAHSSSKLLRTTNAGYNWDVSIYYRITSVCTIDSEKVYAVGNDASSSYLYKSSNRGIIWDSISSPVDSYTALHFFNKDTGVISGGNTFDNFIWRTTDGGLTKQLISTYSGAATGKFFFLKEKINGEYYGWMYYPGSSPLRRTTNSGLTWSSLSSFSEYINSVYFVNRDTGWATPYYARDYLYYTTNGGVNWTTRILPYSQKHDIYFVNSNIGWVSCDLSNKIFVTTNGGFIWGTQTLYGGASFDLYFLDSLNGWAQTSYNSIAHTTNGGGPITATISKNTEILNNYKLYQNYPNPFNPITKIAFDLPKDAKVKLVIYDILGQELKTLINNEFRTAGKYISEFDGSQLASGIYFARILVNDGKDFVSVKKMVLIK